MEIFVKPPNSQSITLKVEASDTIANIKAIIQNKEGTPRKQQRLIYAGKQLQNNQTIEECDIGEHSSVELVPQTDKQTQQKQNTKQKHNNKTSKTIVKTRGRK